MAPTYDFTLVRFQIIRRALRLAGALKADQEPKGDDMQEGAVALDEAHGAVPGSVLRAGRDGIDVACADGVLRIRVLQREGGKAITAADALNGGLLKPREDARR